MCVCVFGGLPCNIKVIYIKICTDIVLSSSEGFGGWQSSGAQCLSNEVKYGTASIFRAGGVLGIMALGRRETPLEQKAHQMRLHLSRIMNQHRLPVNSWKLHCNEAPHDPSSILFSRTWWRQLVSCRGSNQKRNGPRGLLSRGAWKHVLLCCGRGFPVMYSGERWSSVLSRLRLCPAHCSSTWDGRAGRRRAQPLRLQGAVGRKDHRGETALRGDKQAMYAFRAPFGKGTCDRTSETRA